MLPSLGEWPRNQVGASDRKLIVHTDKEHLHMAQISLTILDEKDMTKASYPPYVPDLAPSDFFLFGQTKQLLQGAEFPDQNSPFDAVVQILTGREKITLNDVFLSWMNQFESYVRFHGDCRE
jgi:hypothetical protein